MAASVALAGLCVDGAYLCGVFAVSRAMSRENLIKRALVSLLMAAATLGALVSVTLKATTDPGEDRFVAFGLLVTGWIWFAALVFLNWVNLGAPMEERLDTCGKAQHVEPTTGYTLSDVGWTRIDV